MGKAAYPTGADLAAVLAGGGITVSAALSALLDDAAAAGRYAFEAATGRVMLAGVTDVEKEFSTPSPNAGILDIPDLVELTGITYNPQGGSAETLVDATDYYLQPDNAPDEGKPWTQVRLRRSWYLPLWYGNLRSIRITGRWGYADEIPEDAWLAMVYLGLTSQASMIIRSTTGGVKSRKEADRAEEYGTSAADIVQAWESTAGSAVSRYRRVWI